MKPEQVLSWIDAHGVSAGAWLYPKNGLGHATYKGGPVGMVLTPVTPAVGNLLVPIRTWTFVKRRLEVTPRTEPSMFKVIR